MFNYLRKTLTIVGIAAVVAFGAAGPANAADDADITLGWTAWTGAEFNTKLARQIIENNWDYDVGLTMSAIALQFQGVANGDIDGMLMAWLPDTHASYWERYKNDVVDLGPLFEGAKLGWAVPAYVPEDKLSSIADLKNNSEAQEKLEGIITGIDPGAGLMQLSEDTIKAYGLDDYTLRSSSASAMTAALARAVENKEWIVVTAWSPHWMFGRFDLRYLEDPKGTLGGPQHSNAVVRKGFKEDYPEVARMLKNFYIPLDMLQSYLYIAQQTSYEDAAAQFRKDHHDMVQKWVSGDNS